MSGILNAFVGGTYSSAPVNTVAPVVTGTATVGQTLSCTTGTWTGLPTPTFTYQWYRSPSTAISGETSSTYVLAVADVGNTIFCRVTATNIVSAVSADSNTTATITAGVPSAPTIGTATATSVSTATVAYTASASDGGSTITSYTAVSSPGGITGSLSTSGSGTITVSGLTPSTSYTFTVFATNAIGNSPSSAASNSITTPAVPAGQVAFTSPGTYTWVVPAGVTSVSVVCVGGGGGGSRNGSGGNPGFSSAGGTSYFDSTSVVRGGGGGAPTASVGTQSVGGTYTGDGGGNGGNGLSTGVQIPFYGGGGAAGYSGNGGYGGQGDGSGTITVNGQAGSGGGASGGGWAGGGGVGILGQGANGAAVTVGPPTGGSGGSGGDRGFTYSEVGAADPNVNKGGNYGGGAGGTYWVQGAGGGLGYKNNISVTPGASITVVAGDWGYPNFQSPYEYGGHGGRGAVRIIWSGGSGITRAFPSTNTGDL